MQQPRWDDRDERLERDEYIIEHDPYEQHDQYDQYNQGASSYGHGYNYYENNYETNNVDPNYPNYTYNNTSNAHSTSHDNNHYYDQFYDANGAPIGGVPGGQRTSAYSTESRIDYSNPNYGFGKHYHTSQSTHDNGAYDPAYHGAVNSYYEGKYDESFPYALGASGASDPKTGGGFLAANERDIKDEELRSQNAFSRALARVFGSNVEARGIERVPEDERDGKHTIGLLLLWWSVNCVVSTFPIGVSKAEQSMPWTETKAETKSIAMNDTDTPAPRPSILQALVPHGRHGHCGIQRHWIRMLWIHRDARPKDGVAHHCHFALLCRIRGRYNLGSAQYPYSARIQLHRRYSWRPGVDECERAKAAARGKHRHRWPVGSHSLFRRLRG
jgi:hypothetical protein